MQKFSYQFEKKRKCGYCLILNINYIVFIINIYITV